MKTYYGYTAARKQCNAKYREDKLETIQVYVKKGQKDIIKEYAKTKGLSVNQFINELIDEALKKE